MNIGIFSDTYYPQINGVATSIRMLEREFNRMGHRVYIFTTSDPHAPQALPRVFRLPSMPFVFLPTHRVAYMYSPKLLMKLKSLDLDIVHTQTEFPVGIFGKVVSEFLHIPMVHTYHTMYEDYVHYIARGHLVTPKMAQQFSRMFCNRARAVIAPVGKTRASLLQYGVVRPISVIPTGIDFSPFNPARYPKEDILALRASYGIAPDDPVVVTVGRVAKEKSMDVLVREWPKLAARLPRAKFVIVGDGPVRTELTTLAGSLGVSDSVIFTGAQPWDNIGRFYQLGDVFTMASTSETQGLTYVEAIASHLPVVVKSDPSVAGLIAHGETGYCFHKDEEASDLLYHVLTHPAEAKIIAENGWQAIQHLSSEHFAKNVETLYLDVLQNKLNRKLS